MVSSKEIMGIKLVNFPHQLKRVSKPPFKSKGANCDTDDYMRNSPDINGVRRKRYG